MTRALLAVVVVTATVAGFSVLTELFDSNRHGTLATTPYGAAGAIVTCGEDTAGQICRIDVDALARGITSQDLVRITDFSSGQVASPAVSHDGTTVVFELHDPPGSSSQEAAELWTIVTDGTGLQRLATQGSGLTEASWGPTLLLVAVAGDGVSEDAALAILDPSVGPSPRVATIDLPGLASPSSPKWSPDNERILFSATAGSITDLYTVRIDGSELTNITNSPETEYAPMWSPDSRSIAFWVGSPSGEEIGSARSTARTRGHYRIPTAVRFPEASPCGRRMGTGSPFRSSRVREPTSTSCEPTARTSGSSGKGSARSRGSRFDDGNDAHS